MRTLNEAQHRLLDRIAEADPLARITGWVDLKANGGMTGPLVSKSDGAQVVANTTGHEKTSVIGA